MPKLPLGFRDRFALFAKTIPNSESIDELAQTNEQRAAKKADFFFENRKIVCELKNLETDTSTKIEKLLKPFGKATGMASILRGVEIIENLAKVS